MARWSMLLCMVEVDVVSSKDLVDSKPGDAQGILDLCGVYIPALHR